MSDRFQPHDGRPDDTVIRLLAGRYAAPVDPAYWVRLEERILAAVADRRSVSTWLAEWLPLGLVAAALALVVAGLAVVETRRTEATVAYEAAIRSAAPLSVQSVAGPPGTSVREATLEYVISH